MSRGLRQRHLSFVRCIWSCPRQTSHVSGLTGATPEYRPRGATLEGLGWAARYGIKPQASAPESA